MTYAPERFYGTQGADVLHDDIATCYETEIDPFLPDGDPGEWIIEEWTVRSGLDLLPSSASFVERLAEDIASDGGGNDFTEDWYHDVMGDPDVLAAADALREAMAKTMSWAMADKKVAEHKVTWDGEEPLIDGERMYRPAKYLEDS